MKLQRLAGYGPVAAFVSAASLIVFFFIQQDGGAILQAAPNLAVPLAIAFTLAAFVWVGALTVTLFDLELAHYPATSTFWIRFALGSTLVAMVMPAVLALIQFAGIGVPFAVPYALMWVGVGIGVLIHNVDGHRAGLLRGVLPWLGMATGAIYIIVGLAYGAVLFTMALVMVWYYGILTAQVLFIVWAIWLGVRLGRSKALFPATA